MDCWVIIESARVSNGVAPTHVGRGIMFPQGPPYDPYDPYIYIYPLVNMQKAIENLAIEIVSFPMKHVWNFHSYVNVYQRVVWIYDG